MFNKELLLLFQKLTGETEVHVACTEGTTWYLTVNGDLYGCGDGYYGQQGSGGTGNVTTFTQRASDVAHVVCSRFATWYVTTGGDLYGCGDNRYYQQGSGGTVNETTFTKRN